MPHAHRNRPATHAGTGAEGPATPAPAPKAPAPVPPARSAPKAAWIAYADELGIDTAGLTKPEIIEAAG